MYNKNIGNSSIPHADQHHHEQQLTPRFKFDFKKKAKERSCGCLPPVIPFLAFILILSGLFAYLVHMDLQSGQSADEAVLLRPPTKSDNGPVFLLVAAESKLLIT